jgi:hypothetical protein
MDRRNFLKLGGTSIAILPYISFSIAGCSQKKNAYPLLQDFMPGETIDFIGKEYLKENELKDPEFYSGLSKNEAADMVKNDFEKDNTIIVSGWVLSITEARQCAANQIKNK